MSPPTTTAPPKPPPSYPFKRLIICCDGTWQSSNHGNRNVPSNVAKISRSIAPYGFSDQDPDGNKRYQGKSVPQLVYYDAGVGTGMGKVDTLYSGAFGEGLTENVCEAYNFLVNNYEVNDEVYIFGFSRGAYTARSLAGLISEVGICRNDMMDQFWEMYYIYSHRTENVAMEETWWGKGIEPNAKLDKTVAWQFVGGGNKWLKECRKGAKGEGVNVKVVGVFDTVGSLGWPDSAHFNLQSWNESTKYGFHNTNVSPNIKNAFHALAIDEKRQSFGPTLWYLDDENTETNLCQCWFPGVHINIGGGSDETLKEEKKSEGDLESMANITFAWMVDRVREVSLLDFEFDAMFHIMDRYAKNLQKLLKRKHKGDSADVYRGWGVGPINDSWTSSDYLTKYVGGALPRVPGQYHFPPHETDPKIVFGLSPEGGNNGEKVFRRTNEFIHPVVYHARESQFGPSKKKDASGKNKYTKYDPIALQGFERQVIPAQGESKQYIAYKKHVDVHKQTYWEWAKGVKTDPMGSRDVVIPEFVIPYEEDYPFDSLERKLIQAHPELERTIIEKGRKVLEKQFPKEYVNYVKWEDEAVDPSKSTAEQREARHKLEALYTKVQAAGLKELDPKEKEDWEDYVDSYYKPLNDDADDARLFLAALDKENAVSKYRKTEIKPAQGKLE